MNFNIVYIIAELGETIISGLFVVGSVLLGAWLAYKYGLQTYFKQREHEQIMKRYLEQGIDLAIASVEHATGVFFDNYRIALDIIREIIVNRKESSSIIFSKYDESYFKPMPFLKIQTLVGDIIFWQSVQLLFSFVDRKSIWFEHDFRSAVRQTLEGKIDVSIETLLDMTKDKLDEFYKECKRFALLQVELKRLASILEKETTLTWSDLDEFKNRPEVKESVKRLKDEFREELTKADKQNNEPKEVEEQDEQRQ